MHKYIITSLLFFFVSVGSFLHANTYADVVVAKDGTGDYTTLGDALAAIPSTNFQRYIIFIKKGVYTEKIRIENDYVTILGESRDSTVIEFDQLKRDWVKNKDHVGPAGVNIHADDVKIENLTIKNRMPEIGPNAYVIYGTGTRTILKNCNIMGNGANSVSLMDDKSGMYYINQCYIEGTVDFMRAMGWCYINQCSFFQKEAISSLWHASITNPEQRMVVKNSHFDGVEHFFLGRHHYDAEFILLNCQFTDKLADKPIYRKTYASAPEKDRPYIFGDRHYYFNCKKDGEPYAWMKDNLTDHPAKIYAKDITPQWIFGGQWNPETSDAPQLLKVEQKDRLTWLYFDQNVSIQEPLILETRIGQQLSFQKGKGRPILTFTSESEIALEDLNATLKIASGAISNTTSAVEVGFVPQQFKATSP